MELVSNFWVTLCLCTSFVRIQLDFSLPNISSFSRSSSVFLLLWCVSRSSVCPCMTFHELFVSRPYQVGLLLLSGFFYYSISLLILPLLPSSSYFQLGRLRSISSASASCHPSSSHVQRISTFSFLSQLHCISHIQYYHYCCQLFNINRNCTVSFYKFFFAVYYQGTRVLFYMDWLQIASYFTKSTRN